VKLNTVLLLSALLVFAMGTVGIAKAGTPISGSFYVVDLTPSGMCDAFEFVTNGPSNSKAGTYNAVTGIHDLESICDEGISFLWGGFEVPMEKIQPPNDPSGANNNDYDVTGADVSQYYFDYTEAEVLWLFDLTSPFPTKLHPYPTFAIYLVGEGEVVLGFEGPFEIDDYEPGLAVKADAGAVKASAKAAFQAKVKADATMLGLPHYGAANAPKYAERTLF
jgi:hypothetical protein